jgi:hypothetical protein
MLIYGIQNLISREYNLNYCFTICYVCFFCTTKSFLPNVKCKMVWEGSGEVEQTSTLVVQESGHKNSNCFEGVNNFRMKKMSCNMQTLPQMESMTIWWMII